MEDAVIFLKRFPPFQFLDETTTMPREQLREIMARFDLQHQARPFRRCLSCNGLLHSTSLADVKNEVPENAAPFYAGFWRCTSCGKVFWQGSHYQCMTRLIEESMVTQESRL